MSSLLYVMLCIVLLINILLDNIRFASGMRIYLEKEYSKNWRVLRQEQHWCEFQQMSTYNSKLWFNFYCPFSTKTYCAGQYKIPPCRFSVLAIYLAGQSPADIIKLTRVYKVPLSPPLVLSPYRPWQMHGLSIYMVPESWREWRWRVRAELLKKHSVLWWWLTEVRINRQVTRWQWRTPSGVLPFFLSPPSCVRG